MRHYSRICVFSLLLVLAFSTLARAEPPVQINEIAWAGTRASWADEWIELKNVGEETVDLHGWSVRWGDVLIPFIEEDNTLEVRNLELEPGEYMLLERSDDETVPSVEADLIFTGSLSNSGEVIQLENSNGELVDEIDASSGWPAGTGRDGDPPYGSMTKIDGKWKTSQSEGPHEDSDGFPILGTPGEENRET